jgi:hypothetical protein
MKKSIVFVLAFLTVICCNSNPDKIQFEKVKSIDPFIDMISSVELVPFAADSIGRTETSLTTCKVDEGTLKYYGYGSGHRYRAALISSQDTVNYLEGTANVLNLSSDAPIFSKAADGGTILIDSFNPVIYKYIRKELNSYLTFDFGKYSVPESFFKGNDSYISAESLFSSEFALINRYFENAESKFVEIHLQNPKKADFYYGIQRNGKWRWFYAGKAGEDPLSTSFRSFDENGNLISVIDSKTISRLPNDFIRLIKNPEILSDIKTDRIVAKIKLKK